MKKLIYMIKDDLDHVIKNFGIRRIIFDVLYGLFVGVAALFLYYM